MSDLTIVAPRGWWDLADASSFYPTDLPSDWQLSYFANAFDAVLLPFPQWINADPVTIAQWREDVTPRFRFIAEASAQAPAANATLTQALGPTLSDWLSVDSLPIASPKPMPGTIDQRLHPTRCFRCWPAQPAKVANAEGSPQEEATARSQQSDEHGYAALAPPAVHRDLRGARRWLDALIAQHERTPAVIILASPSSADLEAWHRLVELLGLTRGAA